MVQSMTRCLTESNLGEKGFTLPLGLRVSNTGQECEVAGHTDSQGAEREGCWCSFLPPVPFLFSLDPPHVSPLLGYTAL